MRPSEVDHLLGDASKAMEQLKWAPTLAFEQLVGRMVEADAQLLNLPHAHTQTGS
jgi:GDPmannose 4,6-dehydratase